MARDRLLHDAYARALWLTRAQRAHNAATAAMGRKAFAPDTHALGAILCSADSATNHV